MEYRIVCLEEVDSTNTQARRLSLEGAEEGLVLVAERQSAGKGRMGRTWESLDGENLYFSLLLRPTLMPEQAPMLTLVMAYAVAKVLQEHGFDIGIKWPNDLVLTGKKVCGILTEMHLDETRIEDVVVGVGINVNVTCFSEELKEKATSLRLESDTRIKRKELLGEILERFSQEYAQFLKAGDLSFLQDEYNAMLVNCGQEVRVLEPVREYSGYALGMNRRGELLVRKESGEIENVFAGEVSVRGIYGYV